MLGLHCALIGYGWDLRSARKAFLVATMTVYTCKNE